MLWQLKNYSSFVCTACSTIHKHTVRRDDRQNLKYSAFKQTLNVIVLFGIIGIIIIIIYMHDLPHKFQYTAILV